MKLWIDRDLCPLDGLSEEIMAEPGSEARVTR
jgi:hypothetical protein